MFDPCVNCGRRIIAQARGLCSKCYASRAIRDRTPKRKYRKPEPAPWGDREPTMAELDAMIAEQYPTMPRAAADDLDRL